jgi:cellulose synthase/poly-beta-1,6-N-acetylglucosamine synthase-like glycosyltransferase
MNKAEKGLPSITVMLPVRNEERFIAQTLQQICDQDFPRELLDVVVADGMSTDRTAGIVREFAERHPDVRIQILANHRRLSSAGRNLALRHGKGDYFLLIDGHVYIPNRGLLAAAAQLILEHDARVLGRPQPLTPPDIDAFQKLVALARQSPLAHSQESFVYSQFDGWTTPISIGVMYRRDIVDQVGEFDETFDAAEDLEFNYRIERAGVQCYTSPRLAVHYYPRDSFAGLFRQTRRYGYGRAAFVFKHPERFRVETIVPATFVILLVALPLAGLMHTGFLIAWATMTIIYASILGLEGLRLARRAGIAFTWRLPAIIACVHLGLGVGFLEGVTQWPGKLLKRMRGSAR